MKKNNTQEKGLFIEMNLTEAEKATLDAVILSGNATNYNEAVVFKINEEYQREFGDLKEPRG